MSDNNHIVFPKQLYSERSQNDINLYTPGPTIDADHVQSLYSTLNKLKRQLDKEDEFDLRQYNNRRHNGVCNERNGWMFVMLAAVVEMFFFIVFLLNLIAQGIMRKYTSTNFN
ncbi:hypothetical protein DFJ63DRAFT_314161 [Scheffersomyces coipomensis]|uniref:uncharacterized protein n=1 Tax=Scheffersomyces coipomensis TaxID=1788519 RepID=UPI00315D2B8C